ncbi:Arc family DNA-binding protein [Pseudaminobacter sp. NGMCC 1.201702]|uniref:Arc family DNA-binding protein n=1 Tax=Pseudaminobacter sp. NGMCC 1.201702 TaxID=3391825 RepID=UPI0039EF7DDB
MARNDPQVAVRLPPDVKAFIKAEARENASSQNSEIVRAIRAAMKAKGPVEVAASPSHVTRQPA